MSLRLRFVLLLTVLLAGFSLALGLLHQAESRERERLLTATREDGAAMLGRWLTLSGTSLQRFAADYSWWDDMVDFVHQPDDDWAKINLFEVLDFQEVDAMWVLKTDGSLVYTVSDPNLTEAKPAFPLSTAEVQTLVKGHNMPWFFKTASLGILELRGAPIQPSATTDRSDPAHGWFFVARLWNENRIATLEEATGTEIALHTSPPTPLDPTDDTRIQLVQSLADENGTPIAWMDMQRSSPAMSVRASTDKMESTIFIGFGLTMILVLAVVLRRWVWSPLSLIESSLASGDATELKNLESAHHEFGRLARLVRSSFDHKAEIARESISRREAANALQLSETTLREAIDERVRLGRDLHDSVIQTLYASGMGLASVRKQLGAAPPDALTRLDNVQASLNDTIQELRQFINRLEPEAQQTVAFADAVTKLLDFFKAMRPIDSTIEIHEATAQRLSSRQRAQVLQLIREAVSNAVRHGQARQVRITLQPPTTSTGPLRAVLCIEDDGRGFASADDLPSGHGLTNMQERAEEAGGTLSIQSDPGNGTRLQVVLPVKPPTQPR